MYYLPCYNQLILSDSHRDTLEKCCAEAAGGGAEGSSWHEGGGESCQRDQSEHGRGGTALPGLFRALRGRQTNQRGQ